MTYAALQDLQNRAGESEMAQTSDRDNNGEIDAAVVEAALIHADNVINGYVTHLYTIPLTPVPDLVRTWAVSIARYHLHYQGAPDYVEKDHKEALAALKDVARGMISLPVPSGDLVAQTQGGHQASHPEEVFTDAHLRGFK